MLQTSGFSPRAPTRPAGRPRWHKKRPAPEAWSGAFWGFGGDYSGFHFHIEFHPPLRRPNLLKYLAGPEIGGGNFLSDTSAEEKAAELRAAADVHYKRRAD